MHPSGVRIGVPEVTRLGMKESEMKEIASFIKQIVIDKSDPNKVGSAVSKFREQFQKVQLLPLKMRLMLTNILEYELEDKSLIVN